MPGRLWTRLRGLILAREVLKALGWLPGRVLGWKRGRDMAGSLQGYGITAIT